MNALTKFILKVFSSPKIDMQESYMRVRKFQELAVTPARERYRILDRKIYSEDLSHEIPVRIFHPKEKRSNELLLFFHGGGWVIGSIDSYTRDCIQMADELGRTILAVDYLKAPENPFPAGFDDCYRVADLLINHPELTGITGADDLTIIGNSAGGNLAAAVSLRLRDEGKQLPNKQILINPVTHWNHDERSPFASVEENGYDYGLTAKKMQEYMEMYEPDETKRQSPYIAPLMAGDFSNQPETLIITSEFDPLRDEGEAYGHLLKDAGNDVRIFRANDTVHNYIFGPLTPEIEIKSYHLMEEFLDNRLRGSDTFGKKEDDES
ncbi:MULTISPECIES: alpha/beta hydrolase [unclassified Jeotgalibaca]|uniref:alpha/beta hydrolase n=1 Tax=unclassified Jeotgalibaca TaxID=2621505 RepID=UPI003FD3E538